MLNKLILIFLTFSSGLFSQEININNYKIKKTTIESIPLYKIGDLENDELNEITKFFEAKKFDEIFEFYKKLPTKNKNYTIEKLVHQILKAKLNINENISQEQDRLLFELRVNKLFEMGKFTDIDNFYAQLPPNYVNDFINIKRIEAYLLRNEFKNACSLIREEKIRKTFKLGKFDIICSIVDQEFEKARFNLELLKELNVPGDTFFIELAYKIMGDIEISQEELVEKNLEKFKNLTPILLSYLQIAEISPTFENIKEAPVSNLIFILSSPTTSSEIKLYCAERLVRLKKITPNILAEVYQLSSFTNEEIENVFEIYKTLSPVRSRSILYQAIVKEVDPEIKFELIKLLLMNAKKHKLFASISEILKDSMNYKDIQNLSLLDKVLILEIYSVNYQFDEAKDFIKNLARDKEITKKELYLQLIENVDSNSSFEEFDTNNLVISQNNYSLKEFNNILIIYALKNKLNQDLVEILQILNSETQKSEMTINFTDFLSVLSSNEFSRFYFLKNFFTIVEGQDLNDLNNIEKFVILKILKIIGLETNFRDLQEELIKIAYD